MLARIFGCLSFVAVAAIFAACAEFSPDAGPPQVADAGCGLGPEGYGTSLGAPTGPAAQAVFCSADGGTLSGPCDDCEAASCCQLRAACYSDSTCSCADQALDACTATLGPDAGAGAACWSAFRASSTVAEARYECLLAACAEACGISD